MPIYLQHGNMIDYVPPTDMTTDDVVFIGGLVGIPQFPMKSGQAGSLSVDGIYQFDKKEGVAVNFGDVVKYCGTTKLAQDCNADLTLGVAVAEAEANDIGVNVKINSVLPTDGGGGGGGGEVALCGDSGLYLNSNGEVTIRYCGNSAIKASEYDGVYLAVCGDSGLSIQNGELVASGGGGGGGGGGDGLQNLATGMDALSILGEATTSSFSVTIGTCANASGSSSIAVGNYANVSGDYSTALGFYANASGCGSTAIGIRAKALGDYSTALGVDSFVNEAGTTVISAFNDDGSAKTRLYLIGAGSTMSTTFCDGEAGLGFFCKDSNGNIFKRGTIKLSAIMTENTDTFNPSGW